VTLRCPGGRDRDRQPRSSSVGNFRSGKVMAADKVDNSKVEERLRGPAESESGIPAVVSDPSADGKPEAGKLVPSAAPGKLKVGTKGQDISDNIHSTSFTDNKTIGTIAPEINKLIAFVDYFIQDLQTVKLDTFVQVVYDAAFLGGQDAADRRWSDCVAELQKILTMPKFLEIQQLVQSSHPEIVKKLQHKVADALGTVFKETKYWAEKALEQRGKVAHQNRVSGTAGPRTVRQGQDREFSDVGIDQSAGTLEKTTNMASIKERQPLLPFGNPVSEGGSSPGEKSMPVLPRAGSKKAMEDDMFNIDGQDTLRSPHHAHAHPDRPDITTSTHTSAAGAVRAAAEAAERPQQTKYDGMDARDFHPDRDEAPFEANSTALHVVDSNETTREAGSIAAADLPQSKPLLSQEAPARNQSCELPTSSSYSSVNSMGRPLSAFKYGVGPKAEELQNSDGQASANSALSCEYSPRAIVSVQALGDGCCELGWRGTYYLDDAGDHCTVDKVCKSPDISALTTPTRTFLLRPLNAVDGRNLDAKSGPGSFSSAMAITVA
jgi:hypothetical protein